MRNRLASGVAAMILGGAVAIASQAPAAGDASRVHDLLVLVESADRSAALEAATELERIGPSVAPALVETLKTNSRCTGKASVSYLIGIRWNLNLCLRPGRSTTLSHGASR